VLYFVPKITIHSKMNGRRVVLFVLPILGLIAASVVGHWNKTAGNRVRGIIGVLWGGGIIAGALYGKENLLRFCLENGSDPQNASLFLNAGLVVGGILCAAGLYYSLPPGKSSGKQPAKTSAAGNRFPTSLVSAYDRWMASRSRDDLMAFLTVLKANWEILPKGIVKGDVAAALHERFPKAYSQPYYLKAMAELSRQEDSWTE
jgi:hypothetical protein